MMVFDKKIFFVLKNLDLVPDLDSHQHPGFGSGFGKMSGSGFGFSKMSGSGFSKISGSGSEFSHMPGSGSEFSESETL
jgi:hypothetical protein